MKTLIFIVGLVVSSTLIASSSPLKSSVSSIKVDSLKTPTKTDDSCNDTIVYQDGKIIICSIYKIRKSDILYLTCDEEGETIHGVNSAPFKKIKYYAKDGERLNQPIQEKREKRKWKDRTIPEKVILITLGMFLTAGIVFAFLLWGYLIFG